MPRTEVEIIAAFALKLALRPADDPRRARLAAALFEHRNALWPLGPPPDATERWILLNIDATLATVEKLYHEAARSPYGDELFERLAWLPALLRDLEHGGVRLDA